MERQKYDEAMVRFLTLMQERKDKDMTDRGMYPSLNRVTYTVHEGRKYDKVIEVSGEGDRKRQSCGMWINREDGGILKGCWKRPVDLRPRGNIFGADPLAGTNPYGVNYLR